jgi:hypothetical protein
VIESAAPDGNGETILLVEDDSEVRAFVGQMLLDYGCRVIAAGSGDEALSVAQELEQIDLLVTDVVMPGLSGRFAAMLAWAYWPSAANCMQPSGPVDESASMAPATFRPLLGRLLGLLATPVRVRS